MFNRKKSVSNSTTREPRTALKKMLCSFIVDVLLLRQGKRVDEVAVSVHCLNKESTGHVSDWLTFLMAQTKDTADFAELKSKYFREALAFQKGVVCRMVKGLEKECLELARLQIAYYEALEIFITDCGEMNCAWESTQNAGGPEAAFLLFATWLAHAMEEACMGRLLMRRGLCEPRACGMKVGGWLRGCLSVTERFPNS